MNILAKVELAHEPDFVLGRLTVSPSRRELVRDDGQREVVEHRMMQVLIALCRAEGGIVTRDELTMSCWGGRVVGEDSIHRVMSRLRKIANGIGAGSFEIETITKVGYRLTSSGGVSGADRAQIATARDDAPASRYRPHLPFAAIVTAAGLLLVIALAAWAYLGRSTVPVVAVGPADASPSSERLARDLFVKLGTLPQLGSGRWQLVDAASGRSDPDLLFRTGATGPATQPRASVTLLDGRNSSLLWSREFSFPASQESDLHQHISLTAGRVLGCALEARRDGGLPPDLLRLFLNGCAAMAETSIEDPQKTAGIMRAIVSQRPRFAPAWARLLLLDVNVVELGNESGSSGSEAARILRRDIEAARNVAPALPEIKLAQLNLLPPDRYADAFELLRYLKAQAPDKPEVWIEEANVLTRVGRMQDAIDASRRAAELDPLSPAASTQFIHNLAWGGKTELARKELERAERLWPATGALRDAQFAFHLRYGDPKLAQDALDAGHPGHWADPYLDTRLNPSPGSVDRLMRTIRLYRMRKDSATMAYVVQALGEFSSTDETFAWLQQYPRDSIAGAAYVLFRPGLAELRRDPRFMQVAKRIGLVDFWQASGRWPDFCVDPSLRYDCRREAAKLNS